MRLVLIRMHRRRQLTHRRRRRCDIYDMQAQINQQNAAIQMVKDENTRLRAEAKEQQTTDNARMSTIENRYGDLQLLLQQISANVKK